ncbi:MAG TPA: ABC transporter ATP-binding protein [Bacteroidia bacterium]|jgi:subfamily B ATP-binding cassette protein MsbA|nr:ABC transporter ATP-binding protein [Bacteroidia bacterium]
MRKFFGVLKYVNGYWNYAILNITCNILSVIFSLFSISMIFPFLQVLLLGNDAVVEKTVKNGRPAFQLTANAITDIVNYHISKTIYDHGKLEALMIICLFVVGNIFMKNLFRYQGMFFIAPIRNGVVKDMRNKLYDKVLDLPLSYYSEERKGDIISRMTVDVQEIEWSVMQSLEMIFREPITILIFLGTLVVISPSLSIFAFVLLPLSGLLIGRIGKSLRRSSQKSKEKMGLLLSIMEETLGGLRIIKGFNAQKKMSEYFRKENQELNHISVKVYRKTDLASPLSEFMGVSVLVIILYFGGKLVLGNDPTLNASLLITYIAVFSQLLDPAKSFTTAYYNVQKGIASAERIDKILNAEVTIRNTPDAGTLKNFQKEIEYRNVSFAYREAQVGWVLNNINLKIAKGKTIALVGQSGSGKTTLADMLPRFYDPSQGSILIDGIEIKKLKLEDLRALMGIVTQESILFNDTVFGNIAFGMENVTEAQVTEAAKIANAHEFIAQMPEGYQTNIGDRGNKLSGGQRQRISIARAVLKNPPILILDEATSALDTESERLVQDALNNLMKNRTSVVIAHRLSTIQHADEIIVMQKGELIERGTHLELLARNGTYKKLHDLQAFV